MTLQRCRALLCVGMLSVAVPATADACACCAEPGQRSEETAAIDTYNRGEIDRLQFGLDAQFATTAAFPDDIKGVTSPSDEAYRLTTSRTGSTLVFELADRAGRSNHLGRFGRLSFQLPRTMTRFEVDPRGESEGALPKQPKLYKEWRLRGTAIGTGAFAFTAKAPIAPTQATLILHGRGNGCSSAEDFMDWTLLVKGPQTSFTLIGRLATPAPSKSP